jgi:hypothetical protein
MTAVSTSDDSCDCLNLFLGELKFSTLRADALRKAPIALVCWKKHKAYRSLLVKASAIAQCVPEPLPLAGLLECATHFNFLEAIRSIYTSPEFVFPPKECDRSLQIAVSEGKFRAMDILLQEDTAIRQALHSCKQLLLNWPCVVAMSQRSKIHVRPSQESQQFWRPVLGAPIFLDSRKY